MEVVKVLAWIGIAIAVGVSVYASRNKWSKKPPHDE